MGATTRETMESFPFRLPKWELDITLIRTSDGVFFPMTQLCEQLGINHWRQVQKLRDDNRFAIPSDLRELPVPGARGLRQHPTRRLHHPAAHHGGTADRRAGPLRRALPARSHRRQGGQAPRGMSRLPLDRARLYHRKVGHTLEGLAKFRRWRPSKEALRSVAHAPARRVDTPNS